MLALGNPLAEGRRLAESGRRGDERELARLVEANSQARARDPVGPRGRDIQLGREERRGSGHSLRWPDYSPIATGIHNELC